MPATVVIFSCTNLRFSISLKYSARTEKSPQPGHHVGWSAAISFLVRPLRSLLVAGVGAGAGAMLPPRAGISVMDELINYALKLLFAQPRGDVGVGLFDDFFDLESQSVGFVDAADLRIAVSGAQQARKLAVAVE